MSSLLISCAIHIFAICAEYIMKIIYMKGLKSNLTKSGIQVNLHVSHQQNQEYDCPAYLQFLGNHHWFHNDCNQVQSCLYSYRKVITGTSFDSTRALLLVEKCVNHSESAVTLPLTMSNIIPKIHFDNTISILVYRSLGHQTLTFIHCPRIILMFHKTVNETSIHHQVKIQ